MSTSNRLVATTEQKVRAVGPLSLVWAYSGNAYLGQAVIAALEDSAPAWLGDWDRWTLAEISSRVVECVRFAIAGSLDGLRMDLDTTTVKAEFLFAGRTASGEPFVLVIHEDTTAVIADGQAVSMIGSGQIFGSAAAQVLRHYLESSLDIELGRALAWRLVEAVCAVSASGVAPPVQLGQVTPEGAAVLDELEVGSVEEQVQGWKATELGASDPGMTVDGISDVPRIELTNEGTTV